ncbi:MAG TPA: hypothetical protein VGS28_02095 [Candidatus Saccharimonadales bacterium]|nr:hypothetical protein [Candidatus Saccharimonadales bacterium]
MPEQLTPDPEGRGIERRIVVDHERVEEVLGTLVRAYDREDYPYCLDSTRVPQDHRHMPKNLALGTKEHAMFLWTSCYYMRGGAKSVPVMQQLARVYEEAPDLFDPEIARAVPPVVIADLLEKHGLGFQRMVSELWVENASRLYTLYEGDPRKVFENVHTYEGASKRVKNDKRGGGFVGFQEKMTSMILYYLMDEHLIDEFDFPLPVDLHVLRISIANEMVRFEGYGEDENVLSDELLAVLRKIYYDYTKAHGISTLRLCNAVWLYSQALCGLQPGNITIEPEGRENRRGRDTVLEPLPIDMNSERQRRAYERSCGSCAIQATCRWNVPSSQYYIQGGLARRGKRREFPPPGGQESLISFGEAHELARSST